MSGLSLLGEFFSAGFQLFLQFMSHPVTIGSLIRGVCTLVLCCFCGFLANRFPKYKDALEALGFVVFIVGFALWFAFLIYGSGASSFLTAWESRWS